MSFSDTTELFECVLEYHRISCHFHNIIHIYSLDPLKMFALVVLVSFLASAAAFAPASVARFTNKLSMAGDFDAKSLPGVSGPFGFFDPLGLAPDNKRDFMKYRESELKHGRVAMFAFLGIVAGELLGNAGFSLIGADINGPAIFQYQQAEGALGAWSANVIGLTLAVEGYNIVNGWEAPGESEGMAAPKDSYTSGDLKFDPLGLKPTSASALKEIQTKEINNGRLAMLGVAGIVAQELVTGQSIF